MSKNISGIEFGTKDFFQLQTMIFGAGGLLFITGVAPLKMISRALLICSLIYGLLLIAAQYCYTIALKSGKTGICATVYSLGFILPTLSGGIFWNENISIFDIIGISLVIVMIIICGTRKKQTGTDNADKYILPLAAAMLASGGLGIMQKYQQSSDFSDQKSIFLTVAFAFACGISFVMSLAAQKKSINSISKKKLGIAALTGVSFAAANLCNTILSGKLESAILFPVLNIGVIILSILSGIVLYKERITKTDIFVLSLGVIAILMLNITV